MPGHVHDDPVTIRREVDRGETAHRVHADHRGAVGGARDSSGKGRVLASQTVPLALFAEESCEICGRPRKPGGRALHRDHDHKTGKQRGLLCFTCNRFILGKYATAAKLRSAADYLDRYAE